MRFFLVVHTSRDTSGKHSGSRMMTHGKSVQGQDRASAVSEGRRVRPTEESGTSCLLRGADFDELEAAMGLRRTLAILTKSFQMELDFFPNEGDHLLSSIGGSYTAREIREVGPSCDLRAR